MCDIGRERREVVFEPVPAPVAETAPADETGRSRHAPTRPRPVRRVTGERTEVADVSVTSSA